MDTNLMKKVELLKKDAIDVDATRTYIEKIKRMFYDFIESTQGELTFDEAAEEFLDAYRDELKFNPGEAIETAYLISEYSSYRELINLLKGNKSKFRAIISEAKKAESENNKGALKNSFDARKQLVISVRKILRGVPSVNEKHFLKAFQTERLNTAAKIKERLIRSIQENVDFLIEYGRMDEYIKTANSVLQSLGLSEISYQRRNPIPDEYEYANGDIVRFDKEKDAYVKYDKDGNIVNDGEDLSKYEQDIGVIDAFDRDFLEQLSPEDLFMMDIFYRSRYCTERMQLSKAMYAMEKMGIWRQILEGKKEIEEFDDASILECFESQEDENDSFITEEILNMENAIQDLTLEECILVSKLKAKDFKIRSWGTIEGTQESEDLVFAMDNENFRGTIMIQIPRVVLEGFIEGDISTLPKFRGADKIDEEYSKIMEYMYIPATSFFKKHIGITDGKKAKGAKKAYQETMEQDKI